MKRLAKWKIVAGIWALVLVLAGCSATKDTMSGMDPSKMSGMDHSNMTGMGTSSPNPSALKTAKFDTFDRKNVTLMAQVSNLEVEPGKILPVWTFNNSVPGPQIRVKQGETVKVTVKNTLPKPISIHWHGYPVPFQMDGIPGMTQNAIAPGKTYTYEFKATVPGTYWYHSHQDSVNQVDMGLYGSFVVEGKDDKVDRDYTLVLDEWMSHGMNMNGMNMGSMDMGSMNMSGMDHSGMNMNGADNGHGNAADNSANAGHNMSMYDLYTINGKTSSLAEPLKVKKGETVKLRLINAGYLSHSLHLHGHEYKIVATDGNPIANPSVVKDQLLTIAPGERYDIEFTANNPGTWYLEEHGDIPAVKNMKVAIQYEDSATQSDKPNETVKLQTVDMTKYGKPQQGTFTLDQKYDVEYTMNLGTGNQNGQQIFTINNKIYPNTDPLLVKKGDKVKVRFVNTSTNVDHPMHLHGHTFQVLSKNGQPLTGSPEYKDTLNVKPGEEYVVAFAANNPGDWMFHCHDLHHASTGMVTELKYTDFKNNFVPDANAQNNPE
jgi:FtsP/CotA-like multicopper oxidase with cupredoxin domain